MVERKVAKRQVASCRYAGGRVTFHLCTLGGGLVMIGGMFDIQMMDDLTGRSFNQYQIVTPIGKGGMAAVYKAYQPEIDRHVAVKVLPRQFAKDEQFVKRFQLEAKALAKLQHPHILPIYDYGMAEGYIYLVMPYIAGGDLSSLMTSQKLSLDYIVQLISEVGDALDYAHGQGIVHRDVKPSNILINQRGYSLLSDFGLAKLAKSGGSRLTGTGMVIGTPEYMAPEQGLGETVDGRADIYSLGVILYELMTGQTPYQADTWSAIIIKAIQEPMVAPRVINPAIPVAVEQVILRACAKDPDDRYATVLPMVHALQDAAGNGASVADDGSVSSVAVDTASLTGLRRRLRAKDSDEFLLNEFSSVAEPETVEVVETPPSTTSPPTPAPTQLNRKPDTMLWLSIGAAVLGLIVIFGLGGLWWSRTQNNGAGEEPAGSITTPIPNNDNNNQPLPDIPALLPTQADDTQPPPTNPPPPPTPADDGQQSPPAGNDQQSPAGSPPQEAINACVNLSVGSACTVQPPGGLPTVSGTCNNSPVGLACIPDNGPPPSP